MKLKKANGNLQCAVGKYLIALSLNTCPLPFASCYLKVCNILNLT
jgi:hypothetical protein